MESNMSDLLTFYRWNRAHATGRTYPRPAGPNPAAEALKAARADLARLKDAKAHLEDCAAIRDAKRADAAPYIAQGFSAHTVTPPEAGAAIRAAEEAARAYESALKATTAARRYLPESPSLTYQARDVTGTPARRAERLAHISRPEAFGLRLVGRVTPESHGGRNTWDTRESCGWHTDPYGDTFRDGSGLCYGLVYQLPGRKGRARFVAGYEFGGVDGGPTLDLGTVYESASAGGGAWDTDPRDHDDARDAARAADSMAERAAEREREYQTAWALGREYDDAREEAATARRAALALLKERRAARALGSGFPAICETIRGQVRALLATIEAARETQRKALDGEGGNGRLSVYMGEEEKAAFCDAAGLQAFPA
jgi:hypothetical protein